METIFNVLGEMGEEKVHRDRGLRMAVMKNVEREELHTVGCEKGCVDIGAYADLCQQIVSLGVFTMSNGCSAEQRQERCLVLWRSISLQIMQRSMSSADLEQDDMIDRGSG